MTNDPLGKLKGPAIGLMITVIINVIYAILNSIAALSQIITGKYSSPFLTGDESNLAGYIGGLYLGLVMSILNLIVAPIIVIGAIKMMKGKSYGLSRTASILAVIPLTSCCFLLGIPFGIWALVTLGKPEIKSIFR